MENMYWSCADLLTLGTQIPGARDLPAPDILQRRVAALFDQMAQRAAELHIPEPDIAEARYALCAFIDEQIHRSQWPGKPFWTAQPLQLLYFNENTAGEGFFTKVEGLSRYPERAYVLQIFYLCLTLGFQGKYAVRAGEGLGRLMEQLAQQLGRALPPGEFISPHGPPRDAMRLFVRREAPLIGLGLAFFAITLVMWCALKMVLWSSASQAADELTKSSMSTAATMAAPKR